MHERIQQYLSKLEQEQHIHILYACESGSRAWGFPSPDSDYDIRFLYRHPSSCYVSVYEPNDVVQFETSDLLDGSGWDLLKALRLLAKSNSSIFEWLQSPIIYREEEAFTTAFRQILPGFFQPRTVLHHYSGIATRMLQREFQTPKVRIKKYFYVLRPVLASRWIRQKGTPPPVLFQQILPLVEDAAVLRAIEQLLQEKETAREGKQVQRVAALDNFIEAEMAVCKEYAEQLPKEQPDITVLDDFYREQLGLQKLTI